VNHCVINPHLDKRRISSTIAFFLLFILTFAQAVGRPLSNNRRRAAAGPSANPRAYSQTSLSCRIDGISPRDRALSVNCAGDLPAEKFQVRFVDQFAGVDRLSERVYGLKVRDDNGAALLPEIRGDGVYSFSAPGRRRVTIGYEMRLARALDPAQYALVSSLGSDAGFLMAGDLLPRLCSAGGSDADCGALAGRIRARIVAPSGWRVATLEKIAAGEKGGEGDFEIGDAQHAVFFLGRLREKSVPVGEMNLRIAVAGTWGFSDDEVFGLAESIAREQSAMVGGVAAKDALVTLAPFPHPLTGLRSSAVTLGRTNVLMLNPNDDPVATMAHYRRHLAHEMFHFYLPNAFRVRENFDWFWEGFTRYVALVTLARLRLIGLREYLDAIGTEYEAYWFNPLRAQLSLVAASPEKFASAANYDLVYRKGMLVAALYDLELRWQSQGKRNLADVIRALYREYAIPGREIGNREVLDEMRGAGDFSRLIRDDIETAREIDLNVRIKHYGLLIEWNAAGRGKARLKTATKLSVRQQSLLSELAKNSAPPPAPRLP
jgi:predicted metalloprotease with PDZ domain